MSKKYYILVSGIIVFQLGENVNQVFANALLREDTDQVNLSMLGKMQQALQMEVVRKANDPSIQMVDVVIQTVQTLGFMSDEEWNKAPEGMTLQEMEGNAGNA